MQTTKSSILFFLLGVILLVSGCGCGDGDSNNNQSEDVKVAEDQEKKLLEELKPLYLAYYKDKLAGSYMGKTEAEAIQAFEAAYTDLESNSFAAELEQLKNINPQTSESINKVFDNTKREISNTRSQINNPTDLLGLFGGGVGGYLHHSESVIREAHKKYYEKKLELYKNRHKLLKALFYAKS